MLSRHAAGDWYFARMKNLRRRHFLQITACLTVLLAMRGLAAEAEWKPIFDGKTLEGWKETL